MTRLLQDFLFFTAVDGRMYRAQQFLRSFLTHGNSLNSFIAAGTNRTINVPAHTGPALSLSHALSPHVSLSRAQPLWTDSPMLSSNLHACLDACVMCASACSLSSLSLSLSLSRARAGEVGATSVAVRVAGRSSPPSLQRGDLEVARAQPIQVEPQLIVVAHARRPVIEQMYLRYARWRGGGGGARGATVGVRAWAGALSPRRCNRRPEWRRPRHET